MLRACGICRCIILLSGFPLATLLFQDIIPDVLGEFRQNVGVNGSTLNLSG